VRSSPTLLPPLMPDRTRSGGWSRNRRLTASSTQSVGVPSTASRRLPTSLRRSGRRVVKEWLAPVCSCSAATTQTSFDNSRETFSSTLMPGDAMPSSLEIRIRHLLWSIGSAIACDHLLPAHIGLHRLRDRDSAVVALKVLDDGDNCAADCEAGAVQRVHGLRALAAGRAVARLHAPALEGATL